MAKKRVTADVKEAIVDLRLQGLSYGMIATKLDLTPKLVSWHCLALAVEGPQPGKSWDAIRGPAVVQRGSHLVRRFTPGEDRRLLEMEGAGETLAQIARALNRKSNSIRGRLMTLARRDERRELMTEAA